VNFTRDICLICDIYFVSKLLLHTRFMDMFLVGWVVHGSIVCGYDCGYIGGFMHGPMVVHGLGCSQVNY